MTTKKQVVKPENNKIKVVDMDKMKQRYYLIVAIVVCVSIIIPPMIWAMLGKSDKNYCFINLAILAMGMIPSIAGGMIFSDFMGYKKIRFVFSFIISGIVFYQWISSVDRTNVLNVAETSLLGVTIYFFGRVIVLGSIVYIVFQILFLNLMKMLDKTLNKK
jgi:hypothetical protein